MQLLTLFHIFKVIDKPMNKRILILYTSVGLGHKYIALNMGHHFEKAGYEVKLHDVLELQKGILSEGGEWLHSLINRRFPIVWRWLYLSKLVADLTLPWRVPLAGRNYQKVKQVVDGFNPDLVISVQTTGSAIMSYLKQRGWYKGRFVIGFSDYHLHRYWLYDQADLYLANIPEQVEEMKQLGVKQPTVVCGITLPALPEIDKKAVRAKLNLPEDNKVVLVSSGSLGIGFPVSMLKQFIQKLVLSEPKVWVVVVCGKNESMKQDLEKSNLPQTAVLGFYEPMAELYRISDLFLTKPGGLSTAEALQAGVPLQITHWLPGQEEPNYNYLVSHRLVYPVPPVLTAQSLVDTVQTRLNSPTSVSETPAKAIITQKNHEGEVLLNTIEKLFHGQFD